MPKTISGFLSNLNSGSLEWGWNGFLAFGCHSLVVVYHAETMNLVQTLAGHSGCVVKVRWYKENTPRDSSLVDSYDWYLRIASADSTGRIIVWDVLRGISKCSFGEPSAPVVNMQWLHWQDASSDLLVVLSQPATLTLWNADQGTKLWRTRHGDPLVAMTLDPFHYQRIAFLNSSGNLILLSDFSVSNVPTAFGKQYKILPSDSAQRRADSSDLTTRKPTMTLSIKNQLVKAFSAAGGVSATGTVKHGFGDDSSFNEHKSDDTCNQIIFHSSTRNHLFLVYPRDIVLVDVVPMQTVVCLAFDRAASPIVTLLPCRSRDAFYLFQENGMISLRVKKYQSAKVELRNPLTLGYETICHIEQPRPLAKSSKVFSASVEPHMESSVAVVGSNGRISRYILQHEFSGDGPLLPRLVDLVSLNRDMHQTIPTPVAFSLEGTASGIGGSVSVLRMCPAFDGTKHQLVAIGHLDGLVQLVDLRSCEVCREFSIHSCPVRCLEWSGPDNIVSSGCSQSFSSSTVVRNELLFTDVRSGYAKVLRPEQDESPIETLRVSHCCCYLAIAFRRQPLEVWDLRSFRLLRQMSRRCPVVVDMCWSTKHYQVERLMSDADKQPTLDDGVISKAGQAGRELYRENLVVLDFENHLWHIVVKGMHVRDGREVKTQWAVGGSITSMAWKQDILVFGDSDGRVSSWDLESKCSNSHTTKLGSVKRLRFCTFPEDFTAIALHVDGVSLWNVQNLTHVSQCCFSEMNVRCLDADLSEDGCPVLLTSDGGLRLYDVQFSTGTSSVEDHLMSTLFCPMLCSKSGATLVRLLLLNLYRFALLSDEGGLYERLLDKLVDAVRLSSLDEPERVRVVKQLHCIGESRLVALASCSSIVERNLQVASLFGDDWASCFWSVFKGVMDNEQGLDLVGFPSFFDFLLPKELFRISERLRRATVDFKQCSADQLQHHVTALTLLGENETVIQILIESDNSRPSYFSDSLKACLLASNRSSSECQSTIKLVATNLIASGKLTDGIELLRAIDKSPDACRYLQSFGFWEESVWLAKVALETDACTGVMLKWAEHLGSTEACQKTLALLVLLSLAQWSKVLEILLSMRQIPTAAAFVEALRAAPGEPLLKSIPSALIATVNSEMSFYYNLCDSLKPEACPSS